MSPNSKIALVHNGVIYNHDMVRKELPKTLPPVDTAVIPALLQIESLGGISKLDGDAAIAWIAGDDYGVLKIARVSHSPLAIAQSKDGSFFFASTESILDQALAKLGIKPAFKMALSEREGYSIRKGRIVETLSIPQLDPSYEMPVTKSAYSSYRHMTSGASMWSDWDEYPSPASEDSDSPYRTQYEDDFEIFLSNYIEYNTNEFFSYDGYYAGTKEDLWYEFEKVRYEMSDYKEDYATWWRQNA
jgi:asparagine synthetase B (glutamine-hydrolysing)